MTIPRRDPGSFRDPSGAVYNSGDRILRTVMPGLAAERYCAVRQSGLFEELARRKHLLQVQDID